MESIVDTSPSQSNGVVEPNMKPKRNAQDGEIHNKSSPSKQKRNGVGNNANPVPAKGTDIGQIDGSSSPAKRTRSVNNNKNEAPKAKSPIHDDQNKSNYDIIRLNLKLDQ